ncbi:flagellar M-ring protein FliF [Paenibacillaceae bacterium]|nr:flagellar M-ring protein FliF [Paenibacillaceae bacterium]
MNEKIAQYREGISQYWMKFGKKQKIIFVATLGLFLLTVIFLILIFSRTEYELAFKDLDAADAAAIIEYLEGSNISYKLGATGTTISVPSAVASKVKVDIGSQGLVQNGAIGFESFGQSASAFGKTDNEFNVMFRSALNGEIQRLLGGLQGIQKADVLVTLPQETVFMNPDEQRRASASVRLTFKNGARPSQSDIDGYFNLVKTSVPDLTVEDITITSSGPEGELFPSEKLSGSVGTTQLVDTQIQIRNKLETEIKRNIQQFLGRFYGADKITISVASSLDFSQKVSTEMLVRPLADNNNNGIIISEAETNKSATGADAQSGGVPGAGETDVPGYDAVDGNTSSTMEETSRTRNYDVDRITNEIISGPYVVKDMTIGVGLEIASLPEDTRNEITKHLVALVRAHLADSGQDIDDDDQMAKKVTVIAMPFAGTEATAAASGLSWAWIIGIGAAALLLVGGAAYLLARRRRAAEPEEEAELLDQPNVEYPTIDLENISSDSQVRKQLEQLAKRKPEEFVNLLRTWLVDE